MFVRTIDGDAFDFFFFFLPFKNFHGGDISDTFWGNKKVWSKVTVCHGDEVMYLFAAMEDNSDNKICFLIHLAPFQTQLLCLRMKTE